MPSRYAKQGEGGDGNFTPENSASGDGAGSWHRGVDQAYTGSYNRKGSESWGGWGNSDQMAPRQWGGWSESDDQGCNYVSSGKEKPVRPQTVKEIQAQPQDVVWVGPITLMFDFKP